MIINKPYTNEQYAQLAIYCNETDCHIEDKGNYLESVPNEHTAPTYEEQKEARAEAYRIEVDPITSQISRLRDEEQTPEIIQEIDELLKKRSEVVKDIQERYPYPVEEEDE